MRRQPRSFQRTLLSFIAVVLGILLAVMLSVTVYFHHLLDRIQYLDHDISIPQVENLTDILPLPDKAPDEDAGLIGGKGSNLVNILLIGQDRREGEDRARSDTMILCTFNKKTKDVTMTSFLRDLYVPIPGHQSNRINAAYAFGGSSLLRDTLKTNFGIQVDGYVEVDFTQFSQIIDMAGGVSMDLRQDEADSINASVPGNLTAGEQWLTGSQALAYARIRNLDADGDFSRTNRQRKVITALIRAYKDADLSSVLSMVTEALPMISTDMSKLSMLRHAAELFPILAGADIVSQQIPADGTYSHQSIDDMAVLVADLEATRQILRQSLAATPME